MVMWFGFDWQSKAAVVVGDDVLPDAGERRGGAQCFDAHGAGPHAHAMPRANWHYAQ